MATDNEVRRLLSAIYLTNDEEINCSICLDLVPIYIDRAIDSDDMAVEWSSLRRHLELCFDCFEEYEILKDLAEQEQRGDLPDLADFITDLERKRQHR